LAKRAEAHLKSTGIADSALFGPENEFFIFDSARWSTEMRGCFAEIDSVQGAWNVDGDSKPRDSGERRGLTAEGAAVTLGSSLVC
jgi:glutamine synthetase